MPRQPRNIIPGQPHHIVNRGNNRNATFLDEADVEYSLNCLRIASTKFCCGIHSYVIMTNHLHLLVTPDSKVAASDFMQSFKVRYARYFNRRYRRTGTLWEERYFSEVIDSERYFFECARYIELNPVRAGIVQDPSEHISSSFGRNALERADPLVTPHPLYQALAATSTERATTYKSLFYEHAYRARMTTSPDEGEQRPWRWR